MKETHRNRLLSRTGLIWSIIGLVLVVAVLVAIVAMLNPPPPRTVFMTTGPAGSAYAAYGERYRTLLAQQGIELQLLPSAGAVENYARLRDPQSQIDVGFVQGGIGTAQQSAELVSLGTLFYEPLWFFYRGVQMRPGASGLRGKRMSIGPEGSGTRALTLELLARNGIDQAFAELLPFASEVAE